MKVSWPRVSVLTGVLLSGIWSASPVIAQRGVRGQWIDSSGDLVVTVMNGEGRSCTSDTAQAVYQVAGGSRGLLYPDCDNRSSGMSRFEDTDGAERCIGSSIWREGSSNTGIRDTTWTIEAAAPGSSCSTVGQTYNVRLYYSEAPATTRALEPSLPSRAVAQQSPTQLPSLRSISDVVVGDQFSAHSTPVPIDADAVLLWSDQGCFNDYYSNYINVSQTNQVTFNCSKKDSMTSFAKWRRDFLSNQQSSNRLLILNTYRSECAYSPSGEQSEGRNILVPYYNVSLELDPKPVEGIGYYQREKYVISCSIPPSQFIPHLIAGDIISANDEDSSEITSYVEELRIVHRIFQQTYSKVQSLQESIDKKENEIKSLENENAQINNDLESTFSLLRDRLTETCQAIDRRPFDTRPNFCDGIPRRPSQPSLPGSRQGLGLALIRWGTNLLMDTDTVVRTSAETRPLIEDAKELEEERYYNNLLIESRQSDLDKAMAEADRLSEDAYYKYTTDVEERLPGVLDYNTDLELREVHTPSSIMLHIINETQLKIESLIS